MTSSNAFSDLLQRADKLSSTIVEARPTGEAAAGFPKIQRNLDEVFEQGERLWKKTVAADSVTPMDTGRFGEYIPPIADASGPLPKIDRTIDLITKRPLDVSTVSKQATDGVGSLETNLESFLRRERENILMALVEETIQQTTEAIERRQRAAVMTSWEQRKKKLLADSAVGGVGDLSSRDSIYLADERSGLARSRMTDVEMVFARQVSEYTEKILQGGAKTKLVDAFLATARALKENGFSTMWEQAQCMLEVPIQAGRPLLEQRNSQRFKVAVADNALGYLERQFIRHMESIVYGHIEKARLGGVPGIYRLVHAYLNVKMPVPYPGHEDSLIENHPAWAVIYFCLRSGDLGAAIMACEAVGPHLSDFAAAFREMQAKDFEQISTELKTKLNLIYRRHVRSSQDPYKRAVFVIVALCDTTIEDSEIVDTLQNWLWYRLRQVRLCEVSVFEPSITSSAAPTSSARQAPSAADNASLNFLQKQIFEDYGERHFSAGDTPYLFWDALWLTGQFEAAIDYLCRQGEVLRCHGLHIALTAHQSKILLTPDDVQAKMCSQQRNDPPTINRLNLIRLILLYTSKFQDSDPRDAANYLYFLRSFNSPKGENMFCVTLSDLVMETAEFEVMLGSMNPDGTRKPGLVDKFSFDAERLVESVARRCEEKGLNEKAVVLYDLAMNHTKALQLLNDLLAQVCCETPGAGGDRDRTGQVALEIAKRYQKFGCNAEEDSKTTFYLLMDLVTFFDFYHEKSYREALEVIQNLNLLPLDVDDVNKYVKTFYGFSDQIKRLLPQILLAIMSILLTEYRRIKGNMTFPTSSGNTEAAEAFKRSGHALVTYVGMIPYCMPGDTTARLVQMEVLMH